MTVLSSATADRRLDQPIGPPLARRYENLDALRGVAAIGVLLFHLSIVGVPQLIPRGYLAVDLFFVLSGFVLSHSYAGRLESIGLLRFMRMRFVRLLPLSVLGTLLGTSYFLLRLAIRDVSLYGLSDVVSGTAFNLVLLPKPWVTQAPTDTVFPTNTPLWSLSMEMLVNALWAGLLFKASNRTIWLVTGCAGVVLAGLILEHGNADLGATWPTYLGGVTRALFGFCAGVLIWRYRPSPRSSAVLSWTCILVPLALLQASGGGPIVEALIALVLSPLAIYGSVLSSDERKKPISSWLGRLSYPLYVVHVPVLMFAAGAVQAFHRTELPTYLVMALIALIFVMSEVLDRFYDSPVRKWLAAGRGGHEGSAIPALPPR